jgi:hypothetical protein
MLGMRRRDFITLLGGAAAESDRSAALPQVDANGMDRPCSRP